jgi:hypothetical protein
LLQAPQCRGSFWVETQLPAQLVCPGRHCSVQVNRVQTWLAAHWLPHEPQLFGSSTNRTQLVPHRWYPGWQTQAPLWQLALAPQVWPQPPQFVGSDCVLTHSPLHKT